MDLSNERWDGRGGGGGAVSLWILSLEGWDGGGGGESMDLFS